MTSARTEFDYDVVDVFTTRAFTGNPLAVVYGTEECSDAELLAIAREFNLSETAFPWPATPGSGADYRLRICTPAVELPFAGHPSVGAAWALRERGLVTADAVVQECGAGLLPLTFAGGDVVLTGGVPTLGDDLDPEAVAAALGLSADDLVRAPRAAGAGLEFVMAVVRDEATVDRARPVPVLLDRVAGPGSGGISLSAQLPQEPSQAGDTGPAVHTRVFAGGVGVDEDPATGSAALGLAVYLAAEGELTPERPRLTIAQGVAMGRPSSLTVDADFSGGQLTRVRVVGSVVPVATGRIRRPDSPLPSPA